MPTDLVTGAFGYTGRRITTRLLDAGRSVATLTRRPPGTHALEERVERRPYAFDDESLRRSLAGIDTVYVTYWMRFPRGGTTWEQMVANVARLVQSAHDSGVRRLVYVSVTNARHDSSTAYFRAKAAAEDAVRALDGRDTGTTGAIVRPTLLYGPEDILINNMAWTLRHLPVFGIPGDGKYRVAPVHVDEVAELCIRQAALDEPTEIDAAGPETLAFNEIVATVHAAVGSRARVLHLPIPVVLITTRVIGLAVHDVVLTRDEIRELMESLLVSSTGSATCPTRFGDWIAAHASEIGRRYSSELGRNFRLQPG